MMLILISLTFIFTGCNNYQENKYYENKDFISADDEIEFIYENLPKKLDNGFVKQEYIKSENDEYKTYFIFYFNNDKTKQVIFDIMSTTDENERKIKENLNRDIDTIQEVKYGNDIFYTKNDGVELILLKDSQYISTIMMSSNVKGQSASNNKEIMNFLSNKYEFDTIN